MVVTSGALRAPVSHSLLIVVFFICFSIQLLIVDTSTSSTPLQLNFNASTTLCIAASGGNPRHVLERNRALHEKESSRRLLLFFDFYRFPVFATFFLPIPLYLYFVFLGRHFFYVFFRRGFAERPRTSGVRSTVTREKK